MERFTLKAARVNAGISQAKAAAYIGMTQATLSRYEAYHFKIPAWAFMKLCEFYGIEPQAVILLPVSTG